MLSAPVKQMLWLCFSIHSETLSLLVHLCNKLAKVKLQKMLQEIEM